MRPRALVYIGKTQHRVEEHTFQALRKLLLAHPEVSPAAFKAALQEQWAILAIDEDAAIAALPRLLAADMTARRTFFEAIMAIVTAAGNLDADAQRRLIEIKQLLETGPPSRGKGQIAAE
jgi:hypothetical protein